MFSRHHNRLAEQLFEVNEQGKYKPWTALDEEGRKWQDNDLFQLARNINVAFFAKTVICDYVSVILGTVRQNTDWHLELGKEIKGVTQTTKRGGGKRPSASSSRHVQVARHAEQRRCRVDRGHLSSRSPGKRHSQARLQRFLRGLGQEKKGNYTSNRTMNGPLEA
ncbi:hypothetical protein L7F22_041644 [Adiantum nelumboides]|nr:hypothetical protein [Adiantum nelumboides]